MYFGDETITNRRQLDHSNITLSQTVALSKIFF